MRILEYSSILSLLTVVGYAQTILPDCGGLPNYSPLIEPTVTPLSNVENGQSWLLSDQNDTSSYFYMAKVKGSPYEMGLAQG